MNQNMMNTINGYGPALRLITPIMTFLIATLAGILLSNMSDLKQDLKLFQKDLLNIDKRVAIIEANRFTASDGQKLTEAIMTKIPPKWLADIVQENKNRITVLENNSE